MIDSHCHLDHEPLFSNISDVIKRSKEIGYPLIAANQQVDSTKIESPHGHDSFLLPIDRYFQILQTYMSQIYRDLIR